MFWDVGTLGSELSLWCLAQRIKSGLWVWTFLVTIWQESPKTWKNLNQEEMSLKWKKPTATLAPIELKQSQHNLITAVVKHHVPNLPVLWHTRRSRLTSHSNSSISNLRSRPCACWCVRLGCKRPANHRSKWMFTLFFLRPCSYFDLFRTERDEWRTCSGHLLVFVVPVTLLTVLLAAWGCFSLALLSVLFHRSRVFSPGEAAGMNRCRGWKCAGRQSYRGVQFTVSYIAAIVFLSASISSCVTCGKDVKFCCLSEWWDASASVALCFYF